MKTISLLTIVSLLTLNTSWSQSNDLPYWDYRSTIPFHAKIGLKYSIGAQNHSFSVIAKIDYAPIRNAVSHFSYENKFHYYDKRLNLKTGLEFEARRNWKIYNKKPARYRKDINSWTYFVKFNFDVEFLLRKINDGYFMQNAEDINGQVLAYNYSLINQHNTSIFRYLSNTNGRHAVTLKHLTDRWGGMIYLQNDFWISILNKHIHNHDHGNTTEFGLSLYRRYDLDSLTNAPVDYYNRKLSFDYSFQIITDRKVANNTSSSFARLGYYSVRDSSVFHGYQWFSLAYQGNFFDLRGGMLIDDLLHSRNLQRWAHQGTTHRALKNRKDFGRFLPLKTKKLYFSEFDFTKDRISSRRKFMEQCYFSNQHIELLPKTKEELMALSDRDVKQLYKDHPALKKAFDQQLCVNQYQYKKSKVMEPTALFPWEGNSAYFKKPRVSFFLDMTAFKQSLF